MYFYPPGTSAASPEKESSSSEKNGGKKAPPPDKKGKPKAAPKSKDPKENNQGTPELGPQAKPLSPEDVDQDNQAATLVEASEEGVPFCEECEKAKAEQDKQNASQDEVMGGNSSSHGPSESGSEAGSSGGSSSGGTSSGSGGGGSGESESGEGESEAGGGAGDEPQTSAEEPSADENQTIEEKRYDYYRKVIESIGSFNDAKMNMNMLGVRGFSNHAPASNEMNAYNDTIFLLYVDAAGKKICLDFKGSVDPGKFATYYNAAGDAHLVDGQYEYKVGTHKGYTAMNQAQEVTIWRDKDKDGDEEPTEEKHYQGYFGINIHAGGSGTKVGEYSAGCQVIWGGKDAGSPFSKFIGLLQKDPDKKCMYSLIDSSKLPSGHPG